jgi:hypothetical protein
LLHLSVLYHGGDGLDVAGVLDLELLEGFRLREVLLLREEVLEDINLHLLSHGDAAEEVVDLVLPHELRVKAREVPDPLVLVGDCLVLDDDLGEGGQMAL